MADDDRRDSTSIGGVRLTHPDKILYPKQRLTKRDLALYLQAAAGRMLPHLRGRPLSLVRCPEGQAYSCFFQRHAGAGLPSVIHRLVIPHEAGPAEEYLYITGTRGLLAGAQLGVLEFHIWGSHIDDVERADRIVFDLDPDPAVAFPAVTEAAGELRRVLEELGLASFALLTGGKGVHVVVPIVRHYRWPTVKGFAKALAEQFAATASDRYVATMSKAKRKGRIFIDHFRNERTASAIAPYSTRAREGAPVAWPVTWDELPGITAANAVSVTAAMRRLAEPDPWETYGTAKQSLTRAILRTFGVAA